MRTIEEICAVIDEIATLTKRYELMQYTEEIRNAYKAEKELIIKALEDEKDKGVKQKKQESIYDSYLKAVTYEIAMNSAIEIVKRGGKE